MEQLFKRLRKPKTKEEKDFAERCYKIGMKNGWCSGRYAIEDGDFIVEEDRLNRKSFSVADDEETLKEFFKFGNWCLGQGIIYRNLCFIQQDNGGDEWLTIKDFQDGAEDFESISWEHIIKEGDGEFAGLLGKLLTVTSSKEYYKD
jgi:hypothetical protein